MKNADGRPGLFLAKITTPRLPLVCLTPAQLLALLEARERLEQITGCEITHAALTPIVHRVIRMKLKKMETAPPADHAWFSYWLIVIQETRFGAGLIGFKGIPTGPSDVEIGYGIDPACQKRGFTTEAVRALADWAFTDERCTGIYADVSKTNPASNKVLEKAGFRRVSDTDEKTFWRLPHPT